MGSELQPFLISEFKSGINTYLQPWIRPADAFQPLKNAYIYRGVVNKRAGYVQFGNDVPIALVITGISKAASAVVTASNAFDADDYGVTQVTFYNVAGMVEINGLTGTVTASSPTTFTVNIDSTGFTAYTSGGIAVGILFSGIGDPIMGIMRYINESTGAQSLVIATTRTLFLYDPGTGNYNIVASPPTFTGNITQFFNWTNWQPTDPTTFVSSTSYLYMTNDVDPITLFDGTNLSRPILYVNSANTDYIKTCFDVKIFTNRLLAILPTLNSTSNPLNQSIYWSALFNPFNFVNDISGNGGQLTAATGDIMQSFKFLRDICIVRFSKSIWTFVYTGSDFNPFRFNRINSSKRTNCPYASIEYDERETGIGSTGLTACDGVNVQRYDIPIIDFYETEMSEQYYSQAFSQRYDNNSESWTLYVSQSSQNPLVGGIAPGADKALVYNFIENTWATHIFTDPLTCLGLYYVITGRTWAEMTFSWQSQDNPWFSYSNQKSAPNLLAGDTTGNVYWMDNEFQVTDNGNPIDASITSTRWNPFIQVGQKVQFGYIDFYYGRNPNCVINLTFYVDNSETPAAIRTLTLDANGTDGNANSEFAMKRIYINAMGEFLQVNMESTSPATFQINGMILWARPAGRLTP